MKNDLCFKKLVLNYFKKIFPKKSPLCLISLLRSYLYTIKFIHWISYSWVLFVYSQNSATITTKVMYISITTKRHSSSIGETPCTAHFSWHNFMSISAPSPSCTLDEWNQRMYIASCVLFPPISIKPSPFIHVNQNCTPFVVDNISLYGYIHTICIASYIQCMDIPHSPLDGHWDGSRFLSISCSILKDAFSQTHRARLRFRTWKVWKSASSPTSSTEASQLVGRATAQAPAAVTLKMDFHFSPSIQWHNQDNIWGSFLFFSHSLAESTSPIIFMILQNKNKYFPKLNTKSPSMIEKKSVSLHNDVVVYWGKQAQSNFSLYSALYYSKVTCTKL